MPHLTCCFMASSLNMDLWWRVVLLITDCLGKSTVSLMRHTASVFQSSGLVIFHRCLQALIYDLLIYKQHAGVKQLCRSRLGDFQSGERRIRRAPVGKGLGFQCDFSGCALVLCLFWSSGNDIKYMMLFSKSALSNYSSMHLSPLIMFTVFIERNEYFYLTQMH